MPDAWRPQSRGLLTVHSANEVDINQQLAQDIARRLTTAIDERGFSVLSVSGGKSPVALFVALRGIHIRWDCVRITLVDERCVPITHLDSNALLVRTHLLQDFAAKAQFVPMIANATEPLPTPDLLAQAASTALVAAGRVDVMVLGMGADGHTASLFPQATNIAQALDLRNKHTCLSIALPTLPENAPYPRITQTLAQILGSRHIVLPLLGQSKLQTLQQAWSHVHAERPISYVLQQTQAPVALWLTH